MKNTTLILQHKCLSLFLSLIFQKKKKSILHSGPNQYSLASTIGTGSSASLKGRHFEAEPSDTPGANAYSPMGGIGSESGGVSMKGRRLDTSDNGIPGLF